jgi:hypothetical protein
MSAAAALARAEAAGLRFMLAPDGRVTMTAPTKPPADVLDDLQRFKPDVQRLLALRLAPLPKELHPPAKADWRSLPYGPQRGVAFVAARSLPGACPCCADDGRWRAANEPEAEPWRCLTCHPPPAGLATIQGRGGIESLRGPGNRIWGPPRAACSFPRLFPNKRKELTHAATENQSPS